MRSRIGAHEALFQKITLLRSKAVSLPPTLDDGLIRAELCKYCCVLASAAIDLCLEDCLIEYSTSQGDVRLSKFVERQLGRGRSPTAKMICQTLGAFDDDWQKSLEKVCDSDQRISSDIGSIVHNRNEIAHGRNSTITFSRLEPWLKTAKRFCTEIELTVFS